MQLERERESKNSLFFAQLPLLLRAILRSSVFFLFSAVYIVAG